MHQGQRLDGLVRADESGNLIALTLTARTAHPIAPNGSTENTPLPEADTDNWNTPLDVAAGVNVPQTPLLAAESASGSAVVWYAETPQPGLYFSVHIAEAETWTDPQFLAFTSAADAQPGIALDYQRQLHLVWEDARPGEFDVYVE